MADDLWRTADQFPLGAIAGINEIDARGPSGPDTRPFGLRYATDPNHPSNDSLDVAEQGYDVDRQIAVVRDGDSIVPVFKHTSNRTSTTTSDSDRRGPDSDSDVGND
jgi:putative ATP-grasp target RiPP